MCASTNPRLDPQLVSKVLEKLHLQPPRSPDMAALKEFYSAWCRMVPFDNVRKIIHFHTDESGPLPGVSACDYFENWLAHGTGGTCWAGARALHAILITLGFDAERALGTMLVAPNLPPNHGSVVVRLEGGIFLLDTSILHDEPLLLLENQETCIDHPAWGVSTLRRGGRWHVAWRPLHKPDGFECRFESFESPESEFQERYELTRGWSPFNYQVCARRNIGDEVIGLAFGNFINLRADGSVVTTRVDDEERRRILIEDFGMSHGIINLLPADRPTPPPPGSRTAAAGMA